MKPVIVSTHVEFDTSNSTMEQMLGAARCLLDYIEQAQGALLELSIALEQHQDHVSDVQTRITRVRTPNI